MGQIKGVNFVSLWRELMFILGCMMIVWKNLRAIKSWRNLGLQTVFACWSFEAGVQLDLYIYLVASNYQDMGKINEKL